MTFLLWFVIRWNCFVIHLSTFQSQHPCARLVIISDESSTDVHKILRILESGCLCLHDSITTHSQDTILPKVVFAWTVFSLGWKCFVQLCRCSGIKNIDDALHWCIWPMVLTQCCMVYRFRSSSFADEHKKVLLCENARGIPPVPYPVEGSKWVPLSWSWPGVPQSSPRAEVPSPPLPPPPLGKRPGTSEQWYPLPLRTDTPVKTVPSPSFGCRR